MNVEKIVQAVGQPFYQFCLNNTTYLGLSNIDGGEFQSHLQFMPLGQYNFKTDMKTFDVSTKSDPGNSDDRTCGYDAYTLATGTNISLHDFRKLT